MDGKIRGFVIFGDLRDDDATEDDGEIYGIYIHPDHWRKGYGAKLLEFGESRLMGKKQLFLWLLEDNVQAKYFYLKNGYTEDGSEKIISPLGDLKAIRMRKSVS